MLYGMTLNKYCVPFKNAAVSKERTMKLSQVARRTQSYYC